jgi:hypothetical protein
MDFATAIRTKYINGTVQYKGRRFAVPAEVFESHWSDIRDPSIGKDRLSFQYETGIKNKSALRATATKGYSIFWAMDK